MTSLSFAAAMEASIRKQFEDMINTAPTELAAFLTAIIKVQADFELLLDRAQYVKDEKYPPVDSTVILEADQDWQQLMQAFSNVRNKSTANLILLWMVLAMFERSGQFYVQQTANSVHPAEKLFFSSLAEIKKMMKRRVDGLIRVMYNEIWGQLGFAPFILGRD